ncbi:MAG: response regulator [Bacilli bacterium]
MKPGEPSLGSVLVVDDASEVRRAIGRLLEGEYELTCSASAQEARAALNEQRFDLVFLDIDLGTGKPTGLDCLRWLPETGQHGAVCLLTGYLSPDLLHEALLLGADDYLMKCDDYILRAEVARLVGLGRLPRDQRPQYKTIADPGLLRSLQLNADQINILVELVKLGFPPDKELADALGLGAKALAERIARIETRFGASSRRQLVRYLDALCGHVRRSQLVWGTGWGDSSSLLASATLFEMPRDWGVERCTPHRQARRNGTQRARVDPAQGTLKDNATSRG